MTDTLGKARKHGTDDTSGKVHKVLLADDHAIVRQGIRCIFEDEEDFEVVGEAASPDETLAALDVCKPDVAILDLKYEGASGFDLIKQVKSRRPRTRVLMLSMYDETYYAERCLRNGADGYVMKQEAPDVIVTAVRRVVSGRVYLSEGLADHMLNTFLDRDEDSPKIGVDALTDRELQVFELYGKGMTTREIAEHLNRSHKTVDAHRAQILDKLNCSSANEMIRRAVRWCDEKFDADPA